MNRPRPVQTEPQRSPTPEQLAEIEREIRALEYGSVEVVVHQGDVFEIKTTKRKRQRQK